MKLPTRVADIEQSLVRFYTNRVDGELDLASVLTSSPFPLEDISRAQAFNTWLTMVPELERRVALPEHGTVAELFKSISSTPLGLITLARTRDWFNSEHRKALLNIRNSYFQQLKNWPDLAVTDQTFIMCDDAYSKGLPWPLYDARGTLRTDNYFETFAPKLISSVMRSDELRGAILQADQSSLLTTLLYELIKNTQDHALFTATNERIDDSVRLVLARFYDLDALDVPAPASPDMPLEPHMAYVQALKERSVSGMRGAKDKRFCGILEFSVLDSGPGFVGRKLQREVNPQEDIEIEYKAVLACLRAGHTTASNPNRGLGLNDVLRALRKMNGFLRIRTNRLSGYREFKVFREQQDTDVTPVLHDWKRGYSTRASAFANVRGAAVSVLLPVEV
ncbi:hypothetical protein [Noviherbaspirillum malthae]|uniref:hypothetical protein n=1 Tax=Noviherbaspirillum malthae TaxID=1260987 RepID=UPI00188DD1A4|nr:hypothetical protein [Noviherbaspirillum malthae]